MGTKERSAYYDFEELEERYINRASSSDELLFNVICILKKYFDDAEEEKVDLQLECDKHNFAAMKKKQL